MVTVSAQDTKLNVFNILSDLAGSIKLLLVVCERDHSHHSAFSPELTASCTPTERLLKTKTLSLRDHCTELLQCTQHTLQLISRAKLIARAGDINPKI